MIELVKTNIDSIKNAGKNMQVKSLYLFGSATKESKFNDQSDLDFVFSFVRNDEGFPVAGYDYFDLLFALEEILGKKVDLVAEEKIKNRFFMKG